MAIKELDPGQSHTFPSTPLIVELSGLPLGILLAALDQAGADAVKNRIGNGSVVLTPRPRRLRLVARPAVGGTFPAGTMLGLSLRTEGTATALVEIVVAGVNVAALPEYELAVLEFAPGRSVLTVPGHVSTFVEPVLNESVAGGMFDVPSAPVVPAVPSQLVAGTPGARHATHADDRHAAAAAVPEDAGHMWLEAGRYAMREAALLPGAQPADPPASAWGLVVDGSTSMRRLHESGQLDPLVGLLCGIYVEWTHGHWAVSSVIAGTRPQIVQSTSTQPTAMSSAAFGGTAPGSWSAMGAAVADVARRVGPDGSVIALTDGIPGDVERVAEIVAASGCRFALVAIGVSKTFGLESDSEHEWWREELAAAEGLAEIPHVSVAAVQLTDEGWLRLGDRRPAELAQRLTRGAGSFER